MANIVDELKKIIFAAKIGPCYSQEEWQKFYSGNAKDLPIKHLTSCSKCLDIVNQLHSLPLLNERSPFDVLERDGNNNDDNHDKPNQNNSNSPFSSNKTGSNQALLLKQLEEKRKEHFDYLPQEITFCVNGWPFTSCKVDDQVKLLSLRPNLDEPLESIELLDEKGKLIFHKMFSEEIEQEIKEDIKLNENQQLKFTIIYLNDTPEINLEYTDKRVVKSRVKNSLLASFISSFQQSMVFPKLLWATSVVVIMVTSLAVLQIYWQQKFNKLQQELAKINQEKSTFEDRLIKSETLSRKLSDELASVEQQKIEIKPSIIEKPKIISKITKIDVLSNIKLALVLATRNTISNLINNTRAVVSPILLTRGTQSSFAVRLPKYEENSQEEFTSYLVKINLSKEKTLVEKIKLPKTSEDIDFISIEVKLANTNNLQVNTLAQATIIGIIGKQEVEIATLPLKFE
ncbi:MAG: hypothetical protein IPK14_20925 [Blastocatellia bacterium]|nr:hypothetical protein [Blastocatellia bacterium]